MSGAHDSPAADPGVPAAEFVLRRAPVDGRPDHPYALLWSAAVPESREIGRGDYRWALWTARLLSIPRAAIEHDQRRGVDDGYEGWHLNARVVGRDTT